MAFWKKKEVETQAVEEKNLPTDSPMSMARMCEALGREFHLPASIVRETLHEVASEEGDVRFKLLPQAPGTYKVGHIFPAEFENVWEVPWLCIINFDHKSVQIQQMGNRKPINRFLPVSKSPVTAALDVAELLNVEARGVMDKMPELETHEGSVSMYNVMRRDKEYVVVQPDLENPSEGSKEYPWHYTVHLDTGEIENSKEAMNAAIKDMRGQVTNTVSSDEDE